MNIADKRLLTIFLLLLMAWGIVYQDAIIAMEAVWSRSDTFAHGYFILPISLWLLWRDKATLLNSKVESTWLPLPMLMSSLIVGLIAYAADINVLGQLSAVVSLICLIWLVFGNKFAWRYKFPLAYLLFAVPMGENLIPWLQDVTAWFTVAFLKLNGIPVFADGLYIQIPAGMFEVAVACSGIRYLIASVAVGTLFAYLTYTKLHKQIIFILFALVLPILANGVRAYGIVAIAHYSEMKYATGVDHLIYGWLFFGVVIMLMFWVGGRFADPETEPEKVQKLTVLRDSNSQNLTLISLVTLPIIATLLLFLTTAMLKSAAHISIKPSKPEPSLSVKGNFDKVEHSNWGITFNDAIQRSHLMSRDGLEIMRAVYANKQDKGELINWDNIIFDDHRWTLIKTSIIAVNDQEARLVLIRNTLGQERLIVYWYEIAGRHLIKQIKVKLMQAINVYRSPQSTAEIIAFSQKGSDEKALLKHITLNLALIEQMNIMAK